MEKIDPAMKHNILLEHVQMQLDSIGCQDYGVKAVVAYEIQCVACEKVFISRKMNLYCGECMEISKKRKGDRVKNMRIIVGVDPGKSTGLVVTNVQLDKVFLKQNMVIHDIHNIIAYIKSAKPDDIIVEDFVTGGRPKDYTALEVIAVLKYVFKEKIKLQPPSCQANIVCNERGIQSRHCVSAFKHVMHYAKGLRNHIANADFTDDLSVGGDKRR